MRLGVLVGSALLMVASTAAAQEKAAQKPPVVTEKAQGQATPPGPPAAAAPQQFKFEMHGFVGASSYIQDGNLAPSEGQQSLFANLARPRSDRLVYGADVRESRFNFAVTGPTAFGSGTPKAVLEIDFFGGFGSGAFGSVSLTPRLRLAYAEIGFKKNAHRILFGQNNDLIFAMAPTSLAHIAFPFGYESGNIGWRRPGVFGFHTFPVAGKSKVEFAWEIGRSQWNDTGGIGNQTVTPGTATPPGPGDAFGFSLGEASGLPATEARLTFTSGGLTLFTTGHWQRIDRTGAGPSNAFDELDVIAGNAGGKAVVGPITLAATGYVGKNLAPLLGSLLQFQPNTFGDINEWGAWVQAGYNFTKELSVWGYAGQARPDEDDIRAAFPAAAARYQNTTLAGLLQYRSGGYAIGGEYIRFITKYATAANGTAVGTGSQYILTGMYFF
jgi:hypothetical protein